VNRLVEVNNYHLVKFINEMQACSKVTQICIQDVQKSARLHQWSPRGRSQHFSRMNYVRSQFSSLRGEASIHGNEPDEVPPQISDRYLNPFSFRWRCFGAVWARRDTWRPRITTAYIQRNCHRLTDTSLPLFNVLRVMAFRHLDTYREVESR